MDKIKIAYLISQHPAASHTFILSEVLELRKLGFEIHAASINEDKRSFDKITEEESSEKEKTFYVKKQGILGALKALFSTSLFKSLKGLTFGIQLASWNLKQQLYHLFYFAEALIIGKWMQKKGITHIHVHFANPAATVAMILCKIFPYTYSISVHGPDEFYDVTTQKLKRKFEGALFVRTIGQYAQSQVMRLCDPTSWNKIEIVPLGIDLEKFIPTVVPKTNQPFEILCVGRLTPNKGQHVLIESVDRLIKEGRDLSLRLIGDGPEMNDLKKLVSEKHLESSVIFEGALSHDRVFEAYKGTDLFVLASFAEGIPVVLMEAMAMEVPCIATHINGIPELIDNNSQGILVIPSDDKSLSESIAQLFDDPDQRRQLGVSGRRKIAEKYNLHKNIPQLASVFRKYLDIK